MKIEELLVRIERQRKAEFTTGRYYNPLLESTFRVLILDMLEYLLMEKKDSGFKVVGNLYQGKKNAFALFDQGKRPSSPELKGLGLTIRTLFTYFEEWKKRKKS